MPYDNTGATELQVSNWIRDQVLAVKFTCEKLVLRHLTMDSRPQGDVGNFPIPVGDVAPSNDVRVVVGQIMEAAQADANSVGGSVQMYALYAYYKDEPTGYTPRKIFRVSPESDFDRDVAPSEPATDKGLAAQAMRHLEAVMKTSVASQGYIFNLLERQVARLQDKDERADQQKIDMMMLMQDMLDGSHARRLKERKEEAGQHMRENALEYLKMAAPIIMNRLAGKPIFPEKNKAFMLLASLLENLRPDQQAFLRDNLEPPQLAVLSEILAEYEKDKASFEGEKPSRAPRATGNALPPPSFDEPDDPDDPDDEKCKRPPRMFQKIQDQILSGEDDLPRDPVLRKLELRGADFASRLANKNEPEK